MTKREWRKKIIVKGLWLEMFFTFNYKMLSYFLFFKSSFENVVIFMQNFKMRNEINIRQRFCNLNKNRKYFSQTN